MTAVILPACPECRLKKLLAVTLGTPTETRKGTTLFHVHRGVQYVVRALKVSLERSNGVHYETHGYECLVCGMWGNARFKERQLEALEELLG